MMRFVEARQKKKYVLKTTYVSNEAYELRYGKESEAQKQFVEIVKSAVTNQMIKRVQVLKEYHDNIYKELYSFTRN